MLGNPRQTWILDFTSCGSGLDSLRWIADSKAHDSGFHMQKFPGFWITLHATTLTISFCFSNWICLWNEKSRHWKLCHLLLWWRNCKRRRCPCSIQFCFNSGSTFCFLLVMFNITIVKKLTHNLNCEFGNHGKCSFVGRGVLPIGFPSFLRTKRWKGLGSIFDWTNTQGLNWNYRWRMCCLPLRGQNTDGLTI